MLPVQQAETLILNLVLPFNPHHDAEAVKLLDAVGRVLAEPVTGQLDFPHWDNSAMDGYAVRYEDVRSPSDGQPVTLDIVEEIPAGYQPQKSIQPGQAARIFTGAVMPAGADTVVIQEDTERQGDRVTILSTPNPQAFVRHQGAFYKAGTPLLQPGIKLQAAEIAVLAAAQCAQVRVFRRPRVAILSTGDELVGIDQPLQPGQIVDSNRYALAALVAEAGCEPVLMDVVPDQLEALRTAISQAIAAADMVLSSGGVSVGDYDYVDEILADLGATIHIRSVAVKPGKPLTVATIRRQEAGDEGVGEWMSGRVREIPSTPSPLYPSTSVSSPLPLSPISLYFGLPGNPVSAMVTFWRFVLPAIRKLSGVREPWHPAFVSAIARQELRSDGKRESYLWGRLELVNGQYEFELAGGSHSSGNLINLAGTNGLAVVPLGETAIARGELVQVMFTLI
ncbi:MAG: molybdopterin molybdotransferase MoeA [Oscillatoriales cyanobacterium C42_A2020_001]|nr:molybdopterin molybdotransferase MoeA [Leptolyngbyaceae cyanobacterium C42_A2020_001]